jgi:mannonate dehydratase
MKLGLGLYRHLLTPENFRFARQAGATHIVAHFTDYERHANLLSTGTGAGAWGITRNQERPWTYDDLYALRRAINAEGLELAALENFDPAHWYDILLDGPRKHEQMNNLKQLIRDMGRVGISIMGYYFSVAGVWGRAEMTVARGNAVSVGFTRAQLAQQTPVPNGMVFNMVYDPNAQPGTIGPVSEDEMWERLKWFLDELLPVAEESGVTLAAHPDDPPISPLRDTGRLITRPEHFQRLLDLRLSPANKLEFCLGTIGEMQTDAMTIYDAVQAYSQHIAYVHFRNVRGTVPDYAEVFIDEGASDMVRVLKLLIDADYTGVLIPDHSPQMTCEAPWHAGMAYTLGWMRGALRALGAL